MKAAAIVEAVAFCAMALEFVTPVVAGLLAADVTGVDVAAGNPTPVAPGMGGDEAPDCGTALLAEPGTEGVDCEPAQPAAPTPLTPEV